ncbi:MAG: hypothetical protein GY725_19905 [bacterium]|nr:hypothetical protein [bacterium]
MSSIAVAAGMALLIVPVSMSRWWLTQDAIEYLLIAHEWVNGAGFVNPVQWFFFLPENPPLPAMAVRAPMISWLAAIPFALGATLSSVIALHGAFACLVTGGVVLVARRFMRLPAAIAAALLFGLAPAWLYLVRFPWTEVVATAAFLVAIATAPSASRSLVRALACAAIAWLAWLSRPNLGALVLAIAVANGLQLFFESERTRLRDVVLHRHLWTYVTGFGFLVLVTRWIVGQATGLAPYSAYGVTAEMLSAQDLLSYQKEFAGGFAFIGENFELVSAQLGLRFEQLMEVLFLDAGFNWVGWGAPLGLLCALRPRRGAVEIRAIAFSLLGFSLLVILLYAGFDRLRHALFPVLTAGLLGAAALDELLQRLEVRFQSSVASRVLPFAPLLLVLTMFTLGPGLQAIPISLQGLVSRLQNGPAERFGATFEEHAAGFCRRMEPQALVAAPDPWMVALWCGNAGMVLPIDLDSQDWQARFLREKQPRYLISDGSPDFSWLRHSRAVRRVHGAGHFVLWETRDRPPDPVGWQPAPPLACAGKRPECARAMGR